MNRRIHICYSDRHYRPDAHQPDTFWYSCSQIAKHIWECIKEAGYDVSYGDTVPEGPIDLLWSNRLCSWVPNVKRTAYFASVAHYEFVNRQVQDESSQAGIPAAEGVYTRGERWKYWQTLAGSGLILAIGNKTIEGSYGCQKCLGRLEVIDCGIDAVHFTPDTSVKRSDVFIHNATRFSIRKGSHAVALAWRKVSPEMPGARLLLMGREGDVDVRKILSNCSNVEYAGQYASGSKDYISRLSSAKWAILPSVAEGQAGTILEAMSCGCIPLASRETGVDADKYHGYAIEHITVDELSRLMAKCWADRGNDLSGRVRKAVEENHDWNKFMNRVVELTRELLAGPESLRPNRFAIGLSFILK